MGNYRPFLQGPLPVANYTRIIIPGRFWTRPPSTKSTRMASSATPLHDSLIELAIPDAHAHAIKWYLKDQFQKKTWANKLETRRKLHSLRLKEGDCVQDHIKQLMTEIFNALSVMEAPLSEEDKVIYVLASLPDSYGVLVTALEASENVPSMEVMTERLLNEERKHKEREERTPNPYDEKAMAALPKRFNKWGVCFNCARRHGHFKRDCLEADSKGKTKHKANKVTEEAGDTSGSESLVVEHAALSIGLASNWIVDSGATCHMCNRRSMFACGVSESLEVPERVILGDGRCLDAVGRGIVELVMKLPGGKKQRCKLWEVLFVPGLSYSLLSVSKASVAGKVTKFSESGCQIFSADKVIACASRCGS